MNKARYSLITLLLPLGLVLGACAFPPPSSAAEEAVRPSAQALQSPSAGAQAAPPPSWAQPGSTSWAPENGARQPVRPSPQALQPPSGRTTWTPGAVSAPLQPRQVPAPAPASASAASPATASSAPVRAAEREAVQAAQADPAPALEARNVPSLDTPRGAPPPPAPAPAYTAPTAPSEAQQGQPAEYILDVGDKLRIVVFGEEDLSGEFEISSTGRVALPLIGEVQAARKTITGLQAEVARLLAEGYLKDPRVSIEVLNYRPFFILGEVVNPGSYNYVNGMTVINAIALAGGFTYRADKDDIEMKRGGGDSGYRRVREETPVLPGDVIRIPERFF